MICTATSTTYPFKRVVAPAFLSWCQANTSSNSRMLNPECSLSMHAQLRLCKALTYSEVATRYMKMNSDGGKHSLTLSTSVAHQLVGPFLDTFLHPSYLSPSLSDLIMSMKRNQRYRCYHQCPIHVKNIHILHYAWWSCWLLPDVPEASRA